MRSWSATTAVTVGLTALSLGYFGWLAQRAASELNDTYLVHGLSRDYRPPYKTGQTEVFDARPGPLPDELRARYRPEHAGPLPTDPVAAARALGLDPNPSSGPGNGLPRLVKHTDRYVLVVGTFAGQMVVFDPTLGVALTRALAPDAPAFALRAASERPW